jgi:hypothetical protein
MSAASVMAHALQRRVSLEPPASRIGKMLPKNIVPRPKTLAATQESSEPRAPRSDIRALAPRSSDSRHDTGAATLDLQVEPSIGRSGLFRCRGCAVGHYILSPLPSCVELTVSVAFDDLVVATFGFEDDASAGTLLAVQPSTPEVMDVARRAAALVLRGDARLVAWLQALRDMADDASF